MIRHEKGHWRVEIYLPEMKRKVRVKPADFGMQPPRNRREAKQLERLALAARDKRRPGSRDETVGSFIERWERDFPEGPRGVRRGESTWVHYRERVKAFGDRFGDRTLRSISRDEARQWAAHHRSSVQVLRTMFSDALEDRLVDDNPFSRLGLSASKGRADITVLTVDEVDLLAETALEVHGGELGVDLRAFILWSAYTCMRPGESYAARYSLLDGDVYHLERQFSSRLGRETVPKHGGVGSVFVPEPAQRAVLDKPRRLGNDLMFLTRRGRQFRQQSMGRAWEPVRSAFMQKLPRGHHLHQRLALDPEDKFDVYELRHMGASFMLNKLGVEPWIIAQQLRHKDDGALVVRLYGHPTREAAIERMRLAFGRQGAVGFVEARGRRAKEA